jgi:hypothetical protein
MKFGLASLAGAFLVASAVSGCSTVIPGTAIDTEKAETEIGQAIEEQIGTEVTLTCPDEVALKPGEEMTCSVSDSDGGSGTVKVSLKDADGGVIWILEDGDTLARDN